MTARISVFRRRGRSFVQVFARSGYAWREVSAEALPEPCSPAELGAAVRSALHASAAAGPPRRWRRSTQDGQLSELAGVTSWLGFARGAVGVGVCVTDGAVRVQPMRRDGGSFTDLVEEEVRLELPLDVVDDAALAGAVEDGLARSV